MTQQLSTPVPPSASPLLTTTRRLAGAHVVLALATWGLAVWMFVAYGLAADTDDLAGLALLFGAAYVVLGCILLALSVGALRARRAGTAYGLGLGAGLFVLLADGPAVVLMLSNLPVYGPGLGVLIGLAALALTACSFVGLVAPSRA